MEKVNESLEKVSVNIDKFRSDLTKRVQDLQKMLLEFDVKAAVVNQFNDIVNPLIHDTANSEAVESALSRLTEFTSDVLSPLLQKYVNNDVSSKLDSSVNDLVSTVKKYQGPAKTGTLAKRAAIKMKGCIFKTSAEEGIDVSDEVIKPKLTKSTDVLIKVYSVGLNHNDGKAKSSHIPVLNNINGKIIGTEFSGEIENLGWLKGDHVHMFPYAIGDRVFGITSHGAVGQYIVASATDICAMPWKMPHDVAVTLPVCGTAALNALKDSGMSEGKSIAVVGAAGAVGNLVVQMASAMGGSSIIGIASGAHAEAVESIGATTFIDYTTDNLEEAIENNSLDIIVDTVSTPDNKLNYEEMLKSKLKEDGKFVSLNANPIDKARKAFKKRIGLNAQRAGFESVDASTTTEDFAEVSKLWEEEKIQPLIDRVVDFKVEPIREAFRALNDNHCQGKVVIKVKEQANFQG